MKSKKAILIMIAGAICFASGVILHFETKNAWTYILYILGYILIILANKIEINKKIDSIDLSENTNSIMKMYVLIFYTWRPYTKQRSGHADTETR